MELLYSLFQGNMSKYTDANYIHEAGTKAMKASMFKYKTQLYEINHLLETAHIQKAMEDGNEDGIHAMLPDNLRIPHAAASKIFTVRQFILAGRKRRCLSSAPL